MLESDQQNEPPFILQAQAETPSARRSGEIALWQKAAVSCNLASDCMSNIVPPHDVERSPDAI
jgi:hypothetical protein